MDMLLVLGCMSLSTLTSAGLLDRYQHKDDTPPIKIAQGELTGVFKTTGTEKKFMAFCGIPYAKPPIGDLRFKKVQSSIKSAADALKVVASLPSAAKLAAKHLMGMDEDCLFLNVYTPVEALPVEKLIPVVVWIHGGSFSTGSGDSMMYGPEYLMDKNVVLVTINYRLGVLGFLSSNTSDAPGNAGLKDQRLALKWVQDNIQMFGGDPAKITLYGESAGSASVHMHILSPSSKGLFSQAIMSSGSAQAPWAIKSNPEEVTVDLATAMGAGPDTVADVKRRVQFLRDASCKDLLAACKKLKTEKESPLLVSGLLFAPVVEPPDGGEDPILSQHPNSILLSGEFNKVPMIIGLNNREGSLAYPKHTSAERLAALQANPTFLIPEPVFRVLDANNKEALSKKITELYFKDQAINVASLPDLVDLFGDAAIVHGSHVATHWHLKHAAAPLYLYYFTLDAFGVVSFLIGAKDIHGAGHGDDVAYVFKNHLVSESGTTDKERVENGTAKMTALISNFVISGNPIPDKTEVLPVEWLPSTLEKPLFMEIGDNLTVLEGSLLNERMQFWDGVMKTSIQDPVFDLS